MHRLALRRTGNLLMNLNRQRGNQMLHAWPRRARGGEGGGAAAQPLSATECAWWTHFTGNKAAWHARLQAWRASASRVLVHAHPPAANKEKESYSCASVTQADR